MSRTLDNQKISAGGKRIYHRPNLIKGPVLTSVTALTSISGVVPPGSVKCWVARAAFGETDIRWMIFREWLVVEAPAWFRNLYVEHGEAIGSWLKDRASMRKIVRALMTPAVNRMLRNRPGCG